MRYPPGHEAEGELIEDEDGAPLPDELLTPARCHEIMARYYEQICSNPCQHVFIAVGDDEYGEVLQEVVDVAFEVFLDGLLDGESQDDVVKRLSAWPPVVGVVVVDQLAPYVLEFRRYLQRCSR